jgi:hypothetical protein
MDEPLIVTLRAEIVEEPVGHLNDALRPKVEFSEDTAAMRIEAQIKTKQSLVKAMALIRDKVSGVQSDWFKDVGA